MTVFWKHTALDDRDRFLTEALDHALDGDSPDPQAYVAALARDERLEAEGEALDGVATYKQGPLPGSRLYVTSDGQHVILYRRVGGEVEIERVMASRTNWQPAG